MPALQSIVSGTNGYDLVAVAKETDPGVTVRARKGTHNHCVIKLEWPDAVKFAQSILDAHSA
jgi:hypothetical protein